LGKTKSTEKSFDLRGFEWEDYERERKQPPHSKR
jgi:hypothetical protein